MGSINRVKYWWKREIGLLWWDNKPGLNQPHPSSKIEVREFHGDCLVSEFHETHDWKDLLVPSNGKKCVGCCQGDIFKFWKFSQNFRAQDKIMADQAGRLRRYRIRLGDDSFLARIGIEHWRNLGLHRWQYSIQETIGKWESIRVFSKLRHDLDDVRGHILGQKPLPSTREVFTEVRRVESRRKIILKTNENASGSNRSGAESSALITHGLGQLNHGSAINGPKKSEFWQKGPNGGPETMGFWSKWSDPRQQKGWPSCKYCRKPGHKEDTRWDLHGKSTNWKLRQNNNCDCFLFSR